MEGALFIGEDLRVLRSSLAAAQADADALSRLVEGIAKDMGVCLDHATLRRECRCTGQGAAEGRAAEPPLNALRVAVAETPEEEH